MLHSAMFLQNRTVFTILSRKPTFVRSASQPNPVLSNLFEVLHLRKEVIQPHLPIRLPCYDFTPVIGLTLDNALLAVRLLASGAPNSHGVTGGVYKARERIHRGMLIRDYYQVRLLVGGVQPTIRTGTAFSRSASAYAVASLCYSHCSTCVAQDVRGMMI